MPWWIGLDLAPGVRVYRLSMERNGLLIGEVAQRSGASRKALRVYESAGILPPSRRTLSGYRLYTAESLAVLSSLPRHGAWVSRSVRSSGSSPSGVRAGAPAPTFAS